MWRKGCSAPTLKPPVYYWEELSRDQNQGSGLSRKQGRASREGPSAAGALKANAPVTPAPGAASLIQTLVGHHTSRRGGASPGEEVAGGWAGLSPNRVPQGTPGHLPGSRTPALPSPSASLSVSVPTRCAVPARGSLPSARRYPGAQSLQTTHLGVPP